MWEMINLLTLQTFYKLLEAIAPITVLNLLEHLVFIVIVLDYKQNNKFLRVETTLAWSAA